MDLDLLLTDIDDDLLGVELEKQGFSSANDRIKARGLTSSPLS